DDDSIIPGFGSVRRRPKSGHLAKDVQLAHHHAPPSALDRALLFPGAQGPAGGVQARSGEFREVLPRERKRDLQTAHRPASRLLGEAHKRPRQAPLHVLGREFAQPDWWLSIALFEYRDGLSPGGRVPLVQAG